MPLGFNSTSNITIDNVMEIANVTSYSELAINVNEMVYGGYLFIILLFTIWTILYLVYQQKNNESPLINMMKSGAIVTVISFLLRGIYISREGVWHGLLTDYQLWIFPILTVILVLIVRASKE